MPKNDRRQFLKNTSLAALGISVIPQISQAENASKSEGDLFIGCIQTTPDLYGEGPFYTENAPVLENGILAAEEESGIPLTITGRVMNADCSQFIEGAEVDIWHANDAGAYDNVGFNLRGKTYTNAEGFYLFETIKPGKYLNGDQFRPSHIHLKITPPNGATLTTQLYFSGDEDIPEDAAASLTSGIYSASGRIIQLVEDKNGNLSGYWDIVLDSTTSNSILDQHLNNGMIYKAYPNPFSNELTINYGVFKDSRVAISVFDIQGKAIAVLEENDLKAEKYEATWKPEVGLPDGHYFISLKVNDFQVHYVKVLKQSAQ